ncbi:hypothetical protein OAC54_00470 [Polaribacter sp.]|nr:hypothetical protein [Polaribacter sp.]
MKKITLLLLLGIVLSACVSKKDFVALQSKHDNKATQLVDLKADLQKCIIEKNNDDAKALALAEQVKSLKEDKKNSFKTS